MVFLELIFFIPTHLVKYSLCMISSKVLLYFVYLIIYYKHHKNYRTIIVHSINLFNLGTHALFVLIYLKKYLSF